MKTRVYATATRVIETGAIWSEGYVGQYNDYLITFTDFVKILESPDLVRAVEIVRKIWIHFSTK